MASILHSTIKGDARRSYPSAFISSCANPLLWITRFSPIQQQDLIWLRSFRRTEYASIMLLRSKCRRICARGTATGIFQLGGANACRAMNQTLRYHTAQVLFVLNLFFVSENNLAWMVGHLHLYYCYYYLMLFVKMSQNTITETITLNRWVSSFFTKNKKTETKITKIN